MIFNNFLKNGYFGEEGDMYDTIYQQYEGSIWSEGKIRRGNRG